MSGLCGRASPARRQGARQGHLAGLLKAGATVGILVAFVTSWALFSISRVPIELAILGWKFTLIRIACTFFVPPMAGVAADWLMRVGR